MRFLVTAIVALMAAFSYIRALNKMRADYMEKTKPLPAKASILVIAVVLAITELIVAFAGKLYVIGLIIALAATIGLAVLQFILFDGRQFRAVTTIALAIGVAAAFCKAGKFDAFQIYNEGLKTIGSILAVFIVPILAVGVCGLIKWLMVSGKLNFAFAKENEEESEDSEEESESTDEEESSEESSGRTFLNRELVSLIVLLFLLILIGIGTYAAVITLKGGVM